MEDEKKVRRCSVQLVCHENDAYVELWKTKRGGYVGRYTYDREGVWYTVGDPTGYCELDTAIPEDVEFHVCDKDWNELFVSSNGDGHDFPCLRFLVNEEWEGCRKALESFTEGGVGTVFAEASVSVQNWLATFKDPNIYGEIAQDYDSNWARLYEDFGKEAILSFQYVGGTYSITKEKRRHLHCDAEWTCYEVGGQYVGALFDASHHGTMYAPNIAVDMVKDALKKIYGSVDRLSCIVLRDGEYSERCMTIQYAAKHGLLQGDFHREVVDRIIENEHRHHTFFTTKKVMQAQFPHYMPDYPTLM